MSAPKRRAIARETLDIYAPVAERLGLYKIKLELEDLGFRALYPQRYRVIERALKRARGNQKEFLGKIETALREALKKAGIDGTVESREKHLYSIYRKMRRKTLAAGAGGRCVRPAHPGRFASTPAIARWAWCTPPTGRCRGASRTTSRSRA